MRCVTLLLFLTLLFSCEQNKSHTEPIHPNKSSESNPVFTLPKLPNEMEFCGERIDLSDEDIRERLEREVLVNAYYQSSTLQSLKRSGRYFPLIERILKEEKVPDDFKYLAVIESGLVQAVSPVGAQGFWQFMPVTGKEYGLRMTNEIDERLHVEKSTHAACQYLKDAHSILKDWVATAASYNRGIGGVKKDMAWQGTSHYFDTHMNSETGRYVFRILAVKIIFENTKAYGYDLEKIEIYKPFETKVVEVKSSISNLAKWSIDQGINYKILIKLNPWILGNKLTVKKQTFQILLPTKQCMLKPYKFYK